jgi:hypothetical protein
MHCIVQCPATKLLHSESSTSTPTRRSQMTIPSANAPSLKLARPRTPLQCGSCDFFKYLLPGLGNRLCYLMGDDVLGCRRQLLLLVRLVPSNTYRVIDKTSLEFEKPVAVRASPTTHSRFLPLERVGQDISVGIQDSLRAGRSVDRIPVGGGARFSAPVPTSPGAHQATYTMGTESFPRVKRPGRGVDSPPHLVPRLKKEKSCISTPPLGFRGLF